MAIKKKIIRKTSDFIALLTELQEQYGDLDVDNLYITKRHEKHSAFINDIQFDKEKNRISLVVDKTKTTRKLKHADVEIVLKSTLPSKMKKEPYVPKNISLLKDTNKLQIGSDA
ncbi:hypothetical protein [Fusobacterium varium]|uniref:hypothetical protein n=1 Tax=Fusobacterium varium TaxID=856 RepID=UPI002432CF75|nr:hypothetical protein [Fusobacterium varium]MCF0171657.1 hypothetical protein [Fusobacterium varium]